MLGWPGQDSAKTLHIHHIETQRTSELRPVYTLGVEGDEQNYFAENILVHNKTIVSPGEPLDDPFSSCVSVENGIKIVDFDEVSVGTTHTQDVRLIPNPECLGRLDGDELTAEVDDPDDAFSVENGLGIPFEQFMQGMDISFRWPSSLRMRVNLRLNVLDFHPLSTKRYSKTSFYSSSVQASKSMNRPIRSRA